MTPVPRPVVAGCAALALAASLTAWPLARAAPGGAGAVRAEDRVLRTVTLGAAQALALELGTGTVRVTARSGRREVQVQVVRQADTSSLLAERPVGIEVSDAGMRVRATPGAPAGDRTVRVEMSIEAPPDLRLGPVTIEDGTLSLRGLQGHVGATVTHGAISADDVSGVLRLETTIGPVEVTRARLVEGGLIRLRAFNGDLRLSFAAPLEHARVMALALNGRVTSPLPLAMKEGWGPRWGEASIGRADRVVSLDVVTGSIRIDVPPAR